MRKSHHQRQDEHEQHREEHSDQGHRDQGPAAAASTDTQEIELSAELVRQLQAERDEAVEGRLRALADFRNYQRRAMESEQRALESGAARVVKAIFPILDHFDVTLSQNPEQMNAQQVMEAVRMIKQDFAKALQSQGLERIEPNRGDVFDPNRHQAVMRQPADDVEPNSIVATLQPGYALGDTVLRPAKVSLSPSAEQE